jgi:hypothetical protein
MATPLPEQERGAWNAQRHDGNVQGYYQKLV